MRMKWPVSSLAERGWQMTQMTCHWTSVYTSCTPGVGQLMSTHKIFNVICTQKQAGTWYACLLPSIAQVSGMHDNVMTWVHVCNGITSVSHVVCSEVLKWYILYMYCILLYYTTICVLCMWFILIALSSLSSPIQPATVRMVALASPTAAPVCVLLNTLGSTVNSHCVSWDRVHDLAY